jgi:hypothetical protein
MLQMEWGGQGENGFAFAAKDTQSPVQLQTRRGPGSHRRKLVAGAALWFHFLGKGLLFSSFWGDRRRGITFNVW